MDTGELTEPSSAPEGVEMEITDLSRPDGPDAVSGSERPRSPFVVRLSRRQRALRGVAASSALILALVSMLGSFSSVRERAAALLFGPTRVATATPAPFPDRFYIVPGVGWASVSLDGRRLSHLPVIGLDAPLRLARGRHQLLWRADPFGTVQCVISVPITGADTCPYDRTSPGDAGSAAWVITFFPSLTDLARDQQTHLEAVIQQSLDVEQSTAIVRPGEWYVGPAGVQAPDFATLEGPEASGHLRAATQPLTATLTLRLATDLDTAQTCHFNYAEVCAFYGQDCRFFCTLPLADQAADWNVLAVARGSWSFVTQGGQTVLKDAPDGLAYAGAAVYLHIRWDGVVWHVTHDYVAPTLAYQSDRYADVPTADDPTCAWLRTELDAQAFKLTNTAQYLTGQYATGAMHAAGCVAVATRQQAGEVPPTAGATLPPAYLLQRFGVLLAANDTAHQLWPYLPVADAYERSLAQQLAASTEATTGGLGSSR
jgi:hypothetical protein